MAKKKIKVVIMKPSHRKGAWLHGVDQDGFQKVVPVSCVGKIREGLSTEKKYKKGSSRETNPILRKIVLKRDNYACTKCGAS